MEYIVYYSNKFNIFTKTYVHAVIFKYIVTDVQLNVKRHIKQKSKKETI